MFWGQWLPRASSSTIPICSALSHTVASSSWSVISLPTSSLSLLFPDFEHLGTQGRDCYRTHIENLDCVVNSYLKILLLPPPPKKTVQHMYMHTNMELSSWMAVLHPSPKRRYHVNRTTMNNHFSCSSQVEIYATTSMFRIQHSAFCKPFDTSLY
jgi:hypothetical protein